MNLNLVLVLALAAYLLVCVLYGLMRGGKKALFRLITVVLSAVFAFIAVSVFKNMLGSESTTEQINSLLAQNGMESIVDIAGSSMLLEEIILKTAGGLIAPIIFFIAFVAFSIVTYLVYFIITLILHFLFKKKNQSGVNRTLSMVYGCVQGLVVVGVLVLTVISYTVIVPEVAPKIEASDAFDASSKQSILDACDSVEELNNTTVVTVYSKLGLEAAAKSLTGYEIETEDETLKIKISDEISSISELYFTFSELSSSQMSEYGEPEAALIKKLGKSFTDSKLLSLAGAELLHNATDAWINGDDFIGIEKPDLGADMEPLFTKLIEIFNESTESQATFKEDIITVADLLAAMAENGVFAATSEGEEGSDGIFDVLAKDGVISAITLPLNSNVRMKALIPEITNLGLKTLANSLGISENTAEIYNEALQNIAKHIADTKAEPDEAKRAEALKPLLKNEFENLGVSIDPDYLDILSEALIEDFGDIDTVTPEYVAEFFKVYSNTVGSEGESAEGGSTEGGESGTAPVFGGTANKVLLAEGSSQSGNNEYTFHGYTSGNLGNTGAARAAQKSLDKIEAGGTKADSFKNSSDIIAAMRSSGTAQINRITLKSLLVSSGSTISNPTAESEALEEIVRQIVGLMDALSAPDSDGVETLKSFSSGLGAALDALAGTDMYGSDKTFKLFAAILQSKMVRGATNISVLETIKISDTHRAKYTSNSTDASFTKLMNVIGSTVNIISSMQNSELTTAATDGSAIKELVKNLTPETAEVIKEVITPERMTDMGIPEDNANTAADLLGNLFDALGEVNEEESEKELNAVENIINLGMAAIDRNSSAEGEVPKGNLFTSSKKSDEGTAGGGEGSESGEGNEGEKGDEGSSSSENDGVLGCTADEMVENIMTSTAVTSTINAIVGKKEESEAGSGEEEGEIGGSEEKDVIDPFGFGESISDEDKAAVNDACNAYLEKNVSEDTPEDEKAEMEKTLENIKKLLGIEAMTTTSAE